MCAIIKHRDIFEHDIKTACVNSGAIRIKLIMTTAIDKCYATLCH